MAEKSSASRNFYLELQQISFSRKLWLFIQKLRKAGI